MRARRAGWLLCATLLAMPSYVGAKPGSNIRSTANAKPSSELATGPSQRASGGQMDAAGLAVVAFLTGRGADLAAPPGRAALISDRPPGLPPPLPPSWLRQWTIELGEALRYPNVAHHMSRAPVRLLHLGTTAFGLRRGAPVAWRALRCAPGDPGSLHVSLRWQGAQGDVLLGVDRRCANADGSDRWLRLVVRCDSQGAVRHTFGLQLTVPRGSRRYPLRLVRLRKGEQAQIELLGGGWLLQLDRHKATASAAGVRLGATADQPTGSRGRRPAGAAPALRRRPTPRHLWSSGLGSSGLGSSGLGSGQPRSRRRLLLGVDRYGANGTLLFDGEITALEHERHAARRAIEGGLPPAVRWRGEALGGVRQIAPRAGATWWLQAIGHGRGPRNAGIAAWRHDATGWARRPLGLPRTSAEGSWFCQRRGERLRCTFQRAALPGARGFEPRRFAAIKTSWKEVR